MAEEGEGLVKVAGVLAVVVAVALVVVVVAGFEEAEEGWVNGTVSKEFREGNADKSGSVMEGNVAVSGEEEEEGGENGKVSILRGEMESEMRLT